MGARSDAGGPGRWCVASADSRAALEALVSGTAPDCLLRRRLSTEFRTACRCGCDSQALGHVVSAHHARQSEGSRWGRTGSPNTHVRRRHRPPGADHVPCDIDVGRTRRARRLGAVRRRLAAASPRSGGRTRSDRARRQPSHRTRARRRVLRAVLRTHARIPRLSRGSGGRLGQMRRSALFDHGFEEPDLLPVGGSDGDAQQGRHRTPQHSGLWQSAVSVTREVPSPCSWTS